MIYQAESFAGDLAGVTGFGLAESPFDSLVEGVADPSPDDVLLAAALPSAPELSAEPFPSDPESEDAALAAATERLSVL